MQLRTRNSLHKSVFVSGHDFIGAPSDRSLSLG